MKIKNKLLLAFGLGLFIFAFSFVFSTDKASAATLNLSGNCSISDAIVNANNDDQSGSANCAAGSGADTIVVPSGTWVINSEQIITEDLSIAGSGVGVSIIDGADVYTGLYCDGSIAGPHVLNVDGITIQNSGAGNDIIGAIDCNLSVTNTEITDFNTYSGVHFVNNDTSVGLDLTLNVDNVYIHDGLGGGVMAFMQLASAGLLNLNTTINRVTTLGLTPYSGNGIGIGVSITGFADGPGSSMTVTGIIRNSTLTSNIVGVIGNASTTNNGVSDVQVTLQNNTIFGNLNSVFPAAGVGSYAGANNGGNSNALLNIQNTIVVNNLASSTLNNCLEMIGSQGGTEVASLNSLGNNLSDDSSCGFNSVGDQENISNIMTKLGPLQDNGGITPTIALLAGNPAIDGGATIGAITSDQRGTSRPQGIGYDIGAYEFNGVNTPNDDNGSSDNNNGSLGGSITPGVPNTGFRLLVNNPAFILVTSFICSIIILVIARNYKTYK